MRDALEAAANEAGIGATTDDVAAYVATHLEERAVARKNAIQAALDASNARDSLAKALKSPTPSSHGRIAPILASEPRAPARVRPHRATTVRENIGPEPDDSTPIIQHKDVRPWLPASRPRRLLPLVGAGLVAGLGTMMFMTHRGPEARVGTAGGASGTAISHSATASMPSPAAPDMASATAVVNPSRAAPEPKIRAPENTRPVDAPAAVTPPAPDPRPTSSGAKATAPKPPVPPAHADDEDGI
jgi:hypothetical protein